VVAADAIAAEIPVAAVLLLYGLAHGGVYGVARCSGAGSDGTLVGDPSDPVSARILLVNYQRVMASLTLADVLRSHEASFERR